MAHTSAHWPLTRHIPEGSCVFCISRTRSFNFQGCEQPFRNTWLKTSISLTSHVYINTPEERLFPQTESSSYMWVSAVTIKIMTVIQEQMGRADFGLSHISQLLLLHRLQHHHLHPSFNVVTDLGIWFLVETAAIFDLCGTFVGFLLVRLRLNIF